MLNCFSNTAPLVSQSSLATNILNNTPVLTKYFEEPKKAIDEILQLSELYNDDKEAYNKSAFEILIKYNVISKEQATKLLEKDKIKISGAKDILDKYQNN